VNPDEPTPRTAVDPNALENLRRFGGDALLSRLVMLFRDQVRIRHAAMVAAVQARDALGARQAAHALKSSAGQVGATGMSELCARIERAGMESEMTTIAALVAEFDTVIPAVDAWLTDRGFPREQ
jgi:HPt (histidine-containing phosphotransfer) domain-containing protein